MNLERQRGITIQTAVTSFQWEDVKVNIMIARPLDFLAEVSVLYRIRRSSIISFCKGWQQAQTRILFQHYRYEDSDNFFHNKIDQEGIDLPMVFGK